MYVTDIISDSFINWMVGMIIIISAHTGAGKTTFVLGPLLQYTRANNWEILYLSNRTILENQLVNKVCKSLGIPTEYFEDLTHIQLPGITLMTYQKLEEMLGDQAFKNEIPYYKYIVLDEIAYLASDCEFRPQMIRTVEWFEQRHDSVRIAISATIEAVIPYLIRDYDEWIPQYDNGTLQISRNVNGPTHIASGGHPDVLW